MLKHLKPNPTFYEVAGPVPDRAQKRGRGWFAMVSVVVIVVVLTAGLWWIGSRIASPEQRAADALPPPAEPVVVPVEMRVLSDTIVVRGDVVPAEHGTVEVTWSGPTEGSVAIVTAPPPRRGEEISEGQLIVEVSGRPMFLMIGELPLWRDLKPGIGGRDVLQLQEFLTRLGATIGDTPGHYGMDTKGAVSDFYRAIGYEPMTASPDETSELKLALDALEIAQGAVRQAVSGLELVSAGPPPSLVLEAELGVNAALRALEDQRVQGQLLINEAQALYDYAVDLLTRLRAEEDPDPDELAEAELAVAVAEGSLVTTEAAVETAIQDAEDHVAIAQARLAEAQADPDTSDARAELAAARLEQENAQAAYEALVTRTGPVVPMGEVVVVGALPTHVAAVHADVGDVADKPLLSLTSSDLVVRFMLDPSAAGIAKVGAPVSIESEATAMKATGNLLSIADELTATPNGGTAFEAIIEVPELLDPDWLGLNVRVTIANASTEVATLVVPESALYAQPDGSTRVVVFEDGIYKEVQVDIRMAVGGYAAISSDFPEVKEGGLVVVAGEWRAETQTSTESP